MTQILLVGGERVCDLMRFCLCIIWAELGLYLVGQVVAQCSPLSLSEQIFICEQFSKKHFFHLYIFCGIYFIFMNKKGSDGVVRCVQMISLNRK